MMKVRMMLPMSIRCQTCGTYMYKGTKFNTRKEDVEGENYLGIQARCPLPAMHARAPPCMVHGPAGSSYSADHLGQVFRFYFRCNACAAEMTMKTDPEHADYTVEQGATRNYEPWREKDRCAALHRQPCCCCCSPATPHHCAALQQADGMHVLHKRAGRSRRRLQSARRRSAAMP